MSKPIWWHLIDRAYNMMVQSGVGNVAEHNPDHNDPIIAWMSDARVYLRSVTEPEAPKEAAPLSLAHDMARILQIACDADEAPAKELLQEIAAIANKHPWPKEPRP